jgi:hypothetical protein
LLKVQVLNPQANTFHQTQAGAIHQPGHQLVRLGQMSQDPGDFGLAHDHRQALGGFSPDGVDGSIQGQMQNVVVEKQQCGQGLILSGGADPVMDGQVGEKGFNLRGVHSVGVAFVVEEDEAPDPIEVSLFGPAGIVFDPDSGTNLIE